jgi:hypothetical protein
MDDLNGLYSGDNFLQTVDPESGYGGVSDVWRPRARPEAEANHLVRAFWDKFFSCPGRVPIGCCAMKPRIVRATSRGFSSGIAWLTSGRVMRVASGIRAASASFRAR